jgi:4-hydroxy-2-oxoheptanedioate aldolase
MNPAPIGTSLQRMRQLLAGGACWTVNPGGASLDAVDALARAGARCLFIDCERTAVNLESVTALTRCAHGRGLGVLLRSESRQPEILVRYLDRGIDGIVVPHTETVAHLEAIAQVLSYVTKGQPQRLFSIAQIESRGAVANVDALAACDAVDAFLIGPNDLSHSLGFLGDTSRAEVTQAVRAVIASLQARQRVWGLPATAENAAHWTGQGARLLYCTLEQILTAGFSPLASALVCPPASR